MELYNILLIQTHSINQFRSNYACHILNLQFFLSLYIMAGLTTLVKVLSVTTSIIETEDPAVTSQRGQVTRSQTYVRRYGIPVIDSYSGICNICRVKV